MASKVFKVTDEGYYASIKHSSGGRVNDTLWSTDVYFDKDLNITKTYSTSSRESTKQSEIEMLTKYAKSQVKKLNQEKKSAEFLVCDTYGSGIVIKEVKLKADGTPNLRDAGNRVFASDIKPCTEKIKEEIAKTQEMKDEILELELKLSRMKGEYREELQRIFDEN